jgi:uncharacterized protein YcnI
MTRAAGRTIRAVLIGSVASVLLTTLLATPAGAHVTVHPSAVPAGTSDVELTFRVPNERDDADTVSLQVFFPSDLPLVAVAVLPVPGWTAQVHSTTLTRPVRTDDGLVRTVVSDITWTATAGGIAPGQYEDFTVSAGQAPGSPGRVVFKTLQTYSSGEVVRWIQVPSSGDPEPDTPAPVLTVTPTAPPAAATGTSSGSGAAEALAVAALVVAVVALAGVVLLARRTRRPGAGREDGA